MLEVILRSDTTQVRDVKLVVDLIENHHVGFCESPTCSAYEAVPLVDQLRIVLKDVMLHICQRADLDAWLVRMTRIRLTVKERIAAHAD